MTNIPKRSEERRRRNKVEGLTQAPAASKPRVPRVDSGWHPLAKDWFRSLAQSGQAKFYEPSDWQYARFVAWQMSEHMNSEKPQAATLGQIIKANEQLLVTDASRRRLRLELLRDSGDVDPQMEARDDVANIISLAVAQS